MEKIENQSALDGNWGAGKERENLLGQENAKDLKQREKNGGKKRRERGHDK